VTDTAAPASVVLAADVMSAPPVGVRPEASVWAAWTLMAYHGVRHLMVTDNGRCVGVLDDRTVFAQWPLGPAALHRKPVAAVMHTPVSCVSATSELRRVAEVMVCEGVDAVPVVNDGGVTVGIVTCSDIIAAVAGVI
jgi:CBS domain-containing protein